MIIFPTFIVGTNNFISLNSDEYLTKSIKQPRENLIIDNFETGTDYGAIVTNDSSGNDLLYTWGNNEYNSLGRVTDLTFDEIPSVVEFEDESGVQMSHGKYDIKDLFFTESTSYAVLTYDGIDHLYD